ncbi:hydroxymethylglutaryl-CoA synthase [Nocardia salmonicida]|uniref:hydroxymethylglutaryl-CoA synthase n=1 Tax=Nocardia salmonicida TaxID=53431 RepID=UPI00364357A2
MSTTMIGIHDISLATTTFTLGVDELAQASGADVDKYRLGIGQDAQSVPAADEDIVTLAASAAQPIIERHGMDSLTTVILATETGIDQSKSAGLYVHSLLNLPTNVRVVELKQACYAATAGLQFAAGLLSRNSAEKILVIATDIARYDVGSSGESTQGAAAVAFLMARDPAIAVVEPVSGLFSADIMDFWRPNHRSTARVDGAASVTAYLEATTNAFDNYLDKGGQALDSFAAFCYHQPFTKMASKAHQHMLDSHGIDSGAERVEHDVGASTIYNRAIGNSYTASLYVGLMSLLDHSGDLAGKSVALISYGSGCVAEFFTLTIRPGYREHLRTSETQKSLAGREPIDYQRYLSLRDTQGIPGRDHEFDRQTVSDFRLAAIVDEKRIYRPNTIDRLAAKTAG